MTASEVIAIAKGEVGYIGKKNKTDDTSVKEAPNGVGTFNKYSRMLVAESYYNSAKDGAPWCCIFIDWLFYTLAGNDKVAATAVKPLDSAGSGAGVRFAHDAYPADRRTTTPVIGAQIFYKDDEGWAHTGLVVDVKGDDIYTIEGNWDSRVSERVVRMGEFYGKDKQYIFDFCLPYYEEEVETVSISREEWDEIQEKLGEYDKLKSQLKGLKDIIDTL